MKCRQHPDIWPEYGIDSDKIDIISNCQECLDVLEYRLRLEIESGNVPLVSKDFTDKVMRNIARQSRLVRSNRFRGFYRNLKNKRLTFIHYVAAAAATIILVMTGSFNMLFRSGPEYGNSINQLVNNIAVRASIKIPKSDYLQQSFRINWEHLRDLKNSLNYEANRQNGR